MKAVDGLENPELLGFIVAELSQEFPEIDSADITMLVEERRQRISRPATGGALFLEVQKLLQLKQDQLVGQR